MVLIAFKPRSHVHMVLKNSEAGCIHMLCHVTNETNSHSKTWRPVQHTHPMNRFYLPVV